ncbi:MFS transporter, partial [Pseudooceanicola sp. 216_PA32_1]
MTDTTLAPARPAADPDSRAHVAILLAVSLCHMLNDVMQSLLAAIYPMLKAEFALDFWQIGLLTMVFQVTASLLQPVVGLVTDRRPMPWSLPLAMGSTLAGLLVLAVAPVYGLLICGAGMIGIGSAVFHPEASRVARAAAGGRFGTAQSVFQVGGNFGSAAGPLLAAFVVLPLGRGSVAWFALVALAAMLILTAVSRWHSRAQ